MSEEANIINNETTTSNGNNSWLASLPEEIRNAESLSKFKDVSSLAGIGGVGIAGVDVGIGDDIVEDDNFSGGIVESEHDDE